MKETYKKGGSRCAEAGVTAMDAEKNKPSDGTDRITDGGEHAIPAINTVKPKSPACDRSDAVAAIALFALGYVYWKWIASTFFTPALGGFVFAALLLAVTAVYMRRKGVRPGCGSVVGFALIFVFSTALALYSNPTVRALVLLYISALYLYVVYTATGNRRRKNIDGMLFFDSLKSAFVMPFGSFGAAFRALGGGKNGSAKKGFGRVLLCVIAGLLLALIPSLCAINLLKSADGAFANLMEKINADFMTAEIWDNIIFAALGVPVALYLFGFLYSCVNRRYGDSLGEDKYEAFRAGLRFSPAAMSCAFAIPLIVIYALFFFSQTAYFLSAFASMLPSGVSYAEYARQGFFQLCQVSLMNAFVIAAMSLFTKPGKKTDGTTSERPMAVRILTTVLSSMTLLLIATALSKMIMYMNRYGLTQKRLYTSYFMLVLAAFFAIVICAQFIPSFNGTKYFAVLFTALFAVLVFSNTDALIARVNIERYENGTLETLDVDMLYELSCDATPYVADFAARNPAKAAQVNDLDNYLKSKAINLGGRRYNSDGTVNRDFKFDMNTFTLSSLRAYKSLVGFEFTN